ncbi:MAG TPA: ATPase P [Coriobacteriia bacterium]|nr:ATPase P [Coriobacteriia bacterium]
MLSIDIPGFGLLELEHLVLDVNGTLAQDGEVPVYTEEFLDPLKPLLAIHAITADTYGGVGKMLEPLGLDVRVIGDGREAEAKLDLVDELGSQGVVAIGNGANDELMLRDAAVGIAVIGMEGAASSAIAAADIVVTSLEAALGLLIDPRRMIAALRR